MNYPWGVNYDEQAPWNEPDLSHLWECEECGVIHNRNEGQEPCYVDQLWLCDHCASEYITMRMGSVSGKTNKLKLTR